MDLILITMFTVMKREEVDVVHMHMRWEQRDVILVIMTKGLSEMFIGGTTCRTGIVWQAQWILRVKEKVLVLKVMILEYVPPYI